MLFRFFILCLASIAIYGLYNQNSVKKETTKPKERIRVVGSSTVFPFAALVAEYYGKKTKNLTPIIEATGTGGGMKAFCEGVAGNTPDIVNASRRMKLSEKKLCQKNGVIDIIEIPLGYDGLVIAGSQKSDQNFNLNTKDIFLALSAYIPIKGKLVQNPYKKWSDIRKDLPNQIIKFLGPPPTSGTRDSFVEMVMESGCKAIPEAQKLSLSKKKCHALREDGAWQDMGENDNLIIQKVNADINNLGIFGFAYYDENKNILKPSKIHGIAPTFDTIKNNQYLMSRILYIYVKKQHITFKPTLKSFILEIIGEDASSEFGYLSNRGLVPLSKEKRQFIRNNI